jgi:hypothetical protein
MPIGFMPSPSGAAKARAARQLQIVLDNIDTLKRTLSGSRLNLQQAQAKIQSLTSQLGKVLHDVSDVIQHNHSLSYLSWYRQKSRPSTQRTS